MKRIFIALVAAIGLSVPAVHAFDLKGLVKGAASAAGKNNSGVDSALGIIGGLLGKTDVTIDQLVGTWQYKRPAVAFQSDNVLKKAGGMAAANAIENKILPYYKMLGITGLTLKIEQDGKFTFTIKNIPAKGTIEKGEDGNFIFHFSALGKVNIGKVTAVITSSGSDIDLTFDATKLMDIATKILGATGNSTLNAASSLLNSYEGLNLGFGLSKVE
ncbi:MAG: DUF4923 family protein [Bacteroidales bacterium]|nr:DUF4923 family protein [Bacteroidales bacterium]MDE6832000.1 DUF4923 family protein [Muribaculaceae bacterium]